MAMTFALVGNQNCGKTTLFNTLTGSNRHVGNFPGVTVDQKVGTVKNNKEMNVVDLPGIYSLRPYTNEEIVTRDFILNQKPDGIINVVDATNIERNLYLTLQLITMKVPMILVLNMMDEVRGNGGTVDVNKMEKELGIPVVPVSAAKNEGIDDLVSAAVRVAKHKIPPAVYDFCEYGPVHRCLHAVTHLIEDHADNLGVSRRFAATKIVEGDENFISRLSLNQNEREMIEHTILEMETEGGLDRNAALAEMRYTFIQKLCKKCVVKSKESKEHKRSVAIDRVLTHRIAAIPLFLAIMCAIFYITFELLGAWLSDLLALGIDALKGVVIGALEKYGLNAAALSFLSEGVFDGVGSVLSFLPFIVVLFFFLSLLEDSGYMARVAFIMDKPLRKIGLSGKSFVPLLMGFGCSVPAIMATRTLSSERDKKLTVMLIPFVSCSAKIVVYSAIASCGLFSHPTLVIFALYLIGILLGILVALALKATAFRGKPIPFVMELPNYRLPSAKSTALLLWDKAKDFIEKAFTVIFLATCIIWFFKSFDTRLLFVGEETERSMLARLGEWVLPLFRPIGVADGSAVASLIAGFSAKEAVIGTLSMLSSDVTTLFSGAAGAFGFLVFVLLYTPCVAAVSTVKKELGSWTKTLGIVAMQCGIAYVAALAFYQIGALL